MRTLSLAAVKKELRARGTKKRAKASAWFFKTGAGQYGEGDVFIGVPVPQQRAIAKKFRELSHIDTLRLLHSREHEFRLTALFILVDQFRRGDKARRAKIYAAYLSNTRWINNWDLVDSSAPHIVGEYLKGKNTSVLFSLARSSSLWERRIAALSTFAFIAEGDARPSLRIAKILLRDEHDLIQKAVGWMLREVGKRCGERAEAAFLDAQYRAMPRTMLRYAIERFPKKLRAHYMARQSEARKE